MSPAGWNLERGLGPFSSASEFTGKGPPKGLVWWQRDRSLGPDWAFVTCQEALHLGNGKSCWQSPALEGTVAERSAWPCRYVPASMPAQ